ncbi:tetratricopeptide repeat protein [Actomonas aquatica]|uniref:protein O-GlcNAc transferase n=1 Tax=Actomonas aquatica TaxID=2866162 RepID=A0ABZ1CD33_9BACT|nr:tetratricopeptide repeat protein [Opitutus sp. WL0086]WRQ89300.1 hypothetical protein K1X11_007760 [Opitutus sp. WL0086]
MPLPNSANQLLQDALRLHRAGRLNDAAARYSAVLRMDQRNFDALHLGGLVALQQGNSDQALRLLAAANRVNPRDRTCLLRLALAERAAGRIDAAEKRLRTLTTAEPPMAEAWDNLGMVLKSRGAIAEALTCHQKATEIDPTCGQHWYNLGQTFCLLGQPEQGLSAQNHALKGAHAYPRARYGRAIALQQLHRLPEALEDYATHLRREPAHFAAHSGRLLCQQYLDQPDPAGRTAALAAWRAALPKPNRLEARSSIGRRLRIGLVSADFRRHSVAWFMLPLLRHLDRSRFVITLYHDHGITDEISAELRGLVDVWRETISQSTPDFVKLLRADALDIAVELGGHTGGNRLAAFAHRLAPVQITYLGYPDTTGVPAIDYRFVDAVTDPENHHDEQTNETRVRFATTAWAYQPPPEAGATQPGPGARGEPVTFGSFNNFAKVSPRTLEVWGRVLAAVPGSRLVLKSPGLTREAALAAAEPAGIPADRLEVLPMRDNTADHLADYEHIDIALDPLPYHGTTTTCEALWMGRPVITLVGERHANRVGASLLSAINHPEWITDSVDAYVAQAAALAADPAALRALHDGALRSAVQASPLLDHAGQAHRFADALIACWNGEVAPPASTPAAA